jgi:hypothetical protein
MRKETTAVKYGDPLPEKQRPKGTVVVTFREVLKRVQQKLGEQGKWAMALEKPRAHWSEAPVYTAVEIELRENGTVRVIEDLEDFGRELGCIDDCERPFPESDFRSAT